MDKNKNRLISVSGFIFNTDKLERRELGIDIIKSFATFFVLSVHYYLNNGFYNMPVDNMPMVIHSAFRWIFYLGVPLFLLSTGYLKRKTKFTPIHYIKLLPVIVTAVLVGIITIAYKIIVKGESENLFIWARSVWAYEQPGYSWYINLFLCLSLIIPFISYAWNSIESQRKKQLMILIFLILTAVPGQINKWIIIKETNTNFGFTPNLWTNIYAVTYFLIGAYIGEYKPKFKKWQLCLIFAECIIYLTAKICVTAEGGTFGSGVGAGYEDIIIVLTSATFFMIFYDMKTNSKVIKAVFASVSSVTLGLYLLSWIYDDTVYKIYKDAGAFENGISMLLSYFKIVPLGFLLSYTAATVLNVITKLITSPIIKFSVKKLTPPKAPSDDLPDKKTSEKEKVSV